MHVGVVLINWNNLSDSLDCINSIMEGEVKPARVLVWDNGSTDGSADLIRQKHPEIDVVVSPRNIGFAAANNLAAAVLLKDELDAIWILNNDTRVDTDCLQNLVAGLDAHPDASAVTAKILYFGKPETIWYAGGEVGGVTFSVTHRGKGEFDHGSYDQDTPTGFVSGCCVLIRTGEIRSKGLFNTGFFAYYEDADWSLRMRGAGLTLYYIPDAVVYHKISASVSKNSPSRGKTSPLQHYYQTRNRLFLIRMHTTNPLRRGAGVIVYTTQRVGIGASHLLLGHGGKAVSIWRGVLHGLATLPKGARWTALSGREIHPEAENEKWRD